MGLPQVSDAAWFVAGAAAAAAAASLAVCFSQNSNKASKDWRGASACCNSGHARTRRATTLSLRGVAAAGAAAGSTPTGGCECASNSAESTSCGCGDGDHQDAPCCNCCASDEAAVLTAAADQTPPPPDYVGQHIQRLGDSGCVVPHLPSPCRMRG
jgi:hypothetical protein